MLGGYNWMTLRRICVKHIIDVCRNNPSLLDYYRYTLNADQSIFINILYNCPKFLIENNCRFINWDLNSVHASSPATINTDTAKRALSSSADFARKFDMNEWRDALNLIDATIDSPTEWLR